MAKTKTKREQAKSHVQQAKSVLTQVEAFLGIDNDPAVALIGLSTVLEHIEKAATILKDQLERQSQQGADEAELREARGGRVIRSWPSESNPSKRYDLVEGKDGRVYCTCPAWRFSRANPPECKHMRAWAASVATGGEAFAVKQ